jgi:hypothetical protein
VVEVDISASQLLDAQGERTAGNAETVRVATQALKVARHRIRQIVERAGTVFVHEIAADFVAYPASGGIGVIAIGAATFGRAIAVRVHIREAGRPSVRHPGIGVDACVNRDRGIFRGSIFATIMAPVSELRIHDGRIPTRVVGDDAPRVPPRRRRGRRGVAPGETLRDDKK